MSQLTLPSIPRLFLYSGHTLSPRIIELLSQVMVPIVLPFKVARAQN